MRLFERVKAYRWDTSRFASRLQGWVGPVASPRKVRLYAVAVGRVMEELPAFGDPELTDHAGWYFEAAEELADRERTLKDFQDYIAEMTEDDEFTRTAYGDFPCLPWHWWWPGVRATASVIESGHLFPSSFSDLDNDIRLSLLRCVFGNPFRPVAFDPAWRSSDAVGVAGRMYESRDFSPMPILADALEDAGCSSDDVLTHCRGAGPHVRGCWVVDLVLGKA